MSAPPTAPSDIFGQEISTHHRHTMWCINYHTKILTKKINKSVKFYLPNVNKYSQKSVFRYMMFRLLSTFNSTVQRKIWRIHISSASTKYEFLLYDAVWWWFTVRTLLTLNDLNFQFFITVRNSSLLNFPSPNIRHITTFIKLRKTGIYLLQSFEW